MRCFGEYKNDRVCDLCKRQNERYSNECEQTTEQDKFVKNNYKKCPDYAEEVRWYRGTNEYGYDEDCKETVDRCKVADDSKCNPTASCYSRFLFGGICND